MKRHAGWVARACCALAIVGTIGCDKFSFDPKADLEQERKGYTTKLTRKEPSPQEYDPATPPPGVREITFPSGELTLKAWIGAPKSDGKKHPAVVFCHGGFAFGADDFEQARPFLDTGYVVVVPSWRGENGNPGHFEMFYGEVDDAIAAGRYAAALPQVDAKRVFIAGHSSGGTLAMLAACLPNPFAAAAAYGPSPDQKKFLQARQWADIAPFNPSDDTETRLRSPKHFVGTLRSRLHLFVGEEDRFARLTTAGLDQAARQGNKTCTVTTLPGDHFTSVTDSIRQTIDAFNATPPKPL